MLFMYKGYQFQIDSPLKKASSSTGQHNFDAYSKKIGALDAHMYRVTQKRHACEKIVKKLTVGENLAGHDQDKHCSQHLDAGPIARGRHRRPI